MKIDTKPYGTIEVDERQKISFPSGILGFEDLREFALLDAQQEPFYWLQSLEDRDVAFVLISPFVFRSDYDPALPEEEYQELDPESEDDLIVFAIVTIPADQTKMTANLQGPLLVNRKKRLGRQAISMDSRWKIRHAILEEMSMTGREAC